MNRGPPSPPHVPPSAADENITHRLRDWTELGAKHVGIVQSLIVTCRLHGIDAYTYLVDVLQRISEHPASRVIE